MASPFRVCPGETPPPAPEARGTGAAMRVELILVLALTTPALAIGIAAHRSFGVALTVALFAWLFAAVSLVRSYVSRR